MDGSLYIFFLIQTKVTTDNILKISQRMRTAASQNGNLMGKQSIHKYQYEKTRVNGSLLDGNKFKEILKFVDSLKDINLICRFVWFKLIFQLIPLYIFKSTSFHLQLDSRTHYLNFIAKFMFSQKQHQFCSILSSHRKTGQNLKKMVPIVFCCCSHECHFV